MTNVPEVRGPHRAVVFHTVVPETARGELPADHHRQTVQQTLTHTHNVTWEAQREDT